MMTMRMVTMMMMAIMMTMMTTMLGWNGCVFFDQRRNHLMEWCNLRSGDSVGGGAAAVVGRPPARQQLSSTRICSFGVFCVFCLSRGFLYFVFAAAARQQLNNRDFVLRRLVHFVFFCGYRDYLDLCLDFLYFCSSVFGWQFYSSIFVFCVFEHISPSAPAVVNGHRGRKYLHTLISIIGLVKTIAFHA